MVRYGIFNYFSARIDLLEDQNETLQSRLETANALHDALIEENQGLRDEVRRLRGQRAEKEEFCPFL